MRPICVFWLFIIPFFGITQNIGGGNLNPGIYTNPWSIKRFMDMRVGLSIHWGPSSLGGKEISWSRDTEIPKDEYDAFYKRFDPIGFNGQEWADLARKGGMKYVLLTSKHHDGFCLWPSRHTNYNIANTRFKRNIVKELAEACRRENIVFGSYYSIIDWYHPEYTPYGHGGPGILAPNQEDSPNFERYLVYMKQQLKELVMDYGAEIIQLDGEWDPSWNHILGSDLYLYLRKLNDSILVNSRVDVGRYHLDKETAQWNSAVYAGDYDERERMVDWIEDAETRAFGKSKTPWQAWVTIDRAQWSYNGTPRLMTSEEIVKDLVNTVGNDGNYLINLGPRPDGTFHPDQVARVEEVGGWLKQHENSIYGTRGGPYIQENQYTSTVQGQTVYVFILDKALKELRLKVANQKDFHVNQYNGGDLRWQQDGEYLTIQLPKKGAMGIRVIRLTPDK